MQGLHRLLSTTGPDPGEDHARRRIEATDRQIDRQIFRAVRPDERGDRNCGGWLAQVEAFGEGL